VKTLPGETIAKDWNFRYKQYIVVYYISVNIAVFLYL
jgi:hypothetical protein